MNTLFETETPINTFTPDQQIRALSWKQPFAELMLHGKIETRTWATKYRGWVLICASKAGYNINQILEISGEYQMKRMNNLSDFEVYYGKAIAIGRLIDCRPMAIEDEDKCFVKNNANLFCHIYDNVQRIESFDWKGTQGWKEVPKELKEQIKILKP